jgi:hypothetical protein
METPVAPDGYDKVKISRLKATPAAAVEISHAHAAFSGNRGAPYPSLME